MRFIFSILFGLVLQMGISQDYTVVKTFSELEKNFFLNNDTTYVINFWATWCKPCVQELPFLEEFNAQNHKKPTKVILVSLDFDRQIESHFKPFLKKNKIKSKVVLLKDKNYNDWVESLDANWTGSIPATIVINGSKRNFLEGELHSSEDIHSLIRNSH